MNLKLIDTFKQRIAQGPVFGPFSKTSDPGIIEAMGNAGFDFVILDLEHGPNSIETAQGLIRAAELTGMLPIVRVPNRSEETISKVLDVGAGGIQVPQVRCARDVEEVTRAARFAPEGERGVCRFVRAAGYSAMDKAEYFNQANQAVIVIQLEGKAAVDNLDEILEAGGFDIVFVGPYDLSQSMGVPGQVDHPLVIEKTQQIVDACLERDIVVGNFTDTPEHTAMWVKQGLRYMSYSVDMGIIHEAASTLVSQFHKLTGPSA